MAEGTNPLVSCLCVTENRPPFMPWLLWCFDRQTWPTRELVIVDSSLQPYESHREDVRVLKADPGASVGLKRNLALQAAQGEIITWFDDDDWQHPEKVARLVAALQDGAPYAGSCSGWFVRLEDQRCVPYHNANWILFNSAGFRRQAVLGVRFPENQREASSTVWMNALRARFPGQGVVLPGEDFFFWLCHTSNLSNPAHLRSFSESIEILRQRIGEAAWGDTHQALADLWQRLSSAWDNTRCNTSKETRKFNVIHCGWRHHLEGGGWRWVCSHIIKHFHSFESNIYMYTGYEFQVRQKIFNPHVAWFHRIPIGPERSLTNLVKSDFWKNNKNYLFYAITVSKNQEDFLRSHGIKNISTVYHPTPLNVPRWSNDKFQKSGRNVYHVGFNYRNTEFFIEFANSMDNYYIFNYLVPMDNMTGITMPSSIKVVPRVTPDKYERILTSSIVFLNLYDATANNTILECIARGTPVLVNPIGGVKEYLGERYPLYYNSLDEAISLLEDVSNSYLLQDTHEYLLKIKQKYSIENFINKLEKVLENVGARKP